MRRRRIASPVARPAWRGLMQGIRWEDVAPIAELMEYVPTESQLEVLCDSTRFQVLVWGRRSGKTDISAFRAIVCGILGGWCMYAGPTYRHASIGFGRVLQKLGSTPLRELIHGQPSMAEGKQLVQFRSGGRIQAFSTDSPDSLIGEGWDLLVFDEAAAEDNPEVFWRYMRPALADRQGSAQFSTTPRGQNWLYDAFTLGQDPGQPEWASHHRPTTVQPWLPQSELDSMASGMTRLDYEQEILAEFLDSAGAVFRGYREVATAEWLEAPAPAARYVIGVDIAQYNDWTVAAVLDLDRAEFVHMERFNQLDYPAQEARLASLSERWNRAPILIDATNNESVWQHISETVWWAPVDPYKFSAPSKAAVINQMAMLIERQEVQLPSGDTDLGRVALGEVGSYRYERTVSGILRTNAPEGKHDDCVIAYALAIEMMMRSVGSLPAVGDLRSPVPAVSMAGRFAGSVPKMGRRRR